MNCRECVYSREDFIFEVTRCRRFPPQVENIKRSIFPVVAWSDWCGEFKSKSPSQPQKGEK